jgi:hypothetical protein
VAESVEHAELRSLIVSRIQTDYGHNGGLSLLVDTGTVPPEKRPRRIGGFCPDVEARTVPASVVFLGEAKSYNDVSVPHTSRQLKAFLEYLAMQADPTLFIAVPLAALGSARSIVRRIQRETGTRDVPTIFLYR